MICKNRLATKPILYTDTVTGKQCLRDDMWAVTTEELNTMDEAVKLLKMLYRVVTSDQCSDSTAFKIDKVLNDLGESSK